MRFLIACLSLAMLSACTYQDWRTADRSSVGLAPSPEEEPAAVVQIYAARAVKWRGHFAVHSWIAIKEANADHYLTYHVMGFRIRRTGSAVVIGEDIPDRRWYGAEPDLVFDLRGEKAASAITQIREVAASYPYTDHYRAWPGPNSNTFISYIIRRVPELGVELPPHAIGKDWINEGDFIGMSESGTGVQASFYGALGVTVGLAEGVELNVLGMSFGVDFWRPAIKLPFVGRLGFKDEPVF